jgi:hypothetical protein
MIEIYKLLSITIYGIFYIKIYSKLIRMEEKILYWIFIFIFFVGGSLSAILFNYKSSIFSSSGMLNIETNFISWSIYFIIVFLVPLLSIILVNKIFKFFTYRNNIIKTTNLNIIYSILIVIFTYVVVNVDINDLLFNQVAYIGYNEALANRYSLQHSGLYIFIIRISSFVFLLALSIEYFFRKQKILSFIYFIIGMIIYGLIDNLIFISKLYFIGFVFSYMVFLFLNINKKYFIFITIIITVLYIFYYFYNMGYQYEASYYNPIIKGITRFTISIPYYIEYYMHNNFDMRIYFHSILIGETITSPNIKVFSTMYNISNNSIEGSLASGIFTYNYANFGIFTILKSLFEIPILVSLYAYITKYNITSIKLSIFFLLVFGIINYSFIIIMVGPVLGIMFFIVFDIVLDFIKSILQNKN